eukprot:6171902-Pleurochrysis_carterae.AAC.3
MYACTRATGVERSRASSRLARRVQEREWRGGGWAGGSVRAQQVVLATAAVTVKMDAAVIGTAVVAVAGTLVAGAISAAVGPGASVTVNVSVADLDLENEARAAGLTLPFAMNTHGEVPVEFAETDAPVWTVAMRCWQVTALTSVVSADDDEAADRPAVETAV